MNNKKKADLPFLIGGPCTNCNACVQVCPRHCISYKNDVMVLSPSECIDCDLCASVCPVVNYDTFNFRYPQTAYAAWSLDPSDRSSSTSGGVASVLYQQALQMGWYITGAIYNSDHEAELCVTDQPDMIAQFKQSKYVYSFSRDCYRKIKDLLQHNHPVLFIGLPCQVAGLLKYVGEKHSLLTTVDIICHGTPGQNVLRNYIRARDPACRASQLTFRSDNEFCFLLRDNKNRKIYRKYGKTDEYLAAFLTGLDYQEQCYSCRYARPERISDLTIGDFWGLGAKTPFHHPYTGAVSLVLVNSIEGAKLLAQCKEKLFLEQREVQEGISGNAQLQYPTPIPVQREKFLSCINKGDSFIKSVRRTLRKEMAQEQVRHFKHSIRMMGSQIKKALSGRLS